MFERVTIRVSDPEASRRFYDVAAATPDLVLEAHHEATRNLHIAFGVRSRPEVDAWWQRLVGAGYASDGEPGPRPQYNDTYYGAFVLDPDGNSVEAVHHANVRLDGIDHLWLRTDDLGSARDRFLGVPGLRLRHDLPERVMFVFEDGAGSFSFVPGTATRNVGLGDVWV